MFKLLVIKTKIKINVAKNPYLVEKHFQQLNYPIILKFFEVLRLIPRFITKQSRTFYVDC